jgi:hypothetical protein
MQGFLKLAAILKINMHNKYLFMSRSCVRAVQHLTSEQQSSNWFLWSVHDYKKSVTWNTVEFGLDRKLPILRSLSKRDKTEQDLSL